MSRPRAGQHTHAVTQRTFGRRRRNPAFSSLDHIERRPMPLKIITPNRMPDLRAAYQLVTRFFARGDSPSPLRHLCMQGRETQTDGKMPKAVAATTPLVNV